MVARNFEQGRSEADAITSGRPSPLKVIIEPEDNPIEQGAEILAGFDIACRYLYYAIADSFEFPTSQYPQRVQEALSAAHRYAEEISQFLAMPPFVATGSTQDQTSTLQAAYQEGFLTVAEYDRLVAEAKNGHILTYDQVISQE